MAPKASERSKPRALSAVVFPKYLMNSCNTTGRKRGVLPRGPDRGRSFLVAVDGLFPTSPRQWLVHAVVPVPNKHAATAIDPSSACKPCTPDEARCRPSTVMPTLLKRISSLRISENKKCLCSAGNEGVTPINHPCYRTSKQRQYVFVVFFFCKIKTGPRNRPNRLVPSYEVYKPQLSEVLSGKSPFDCGEGPTRSKPRWGNSYGYFGDSSSIASGNLHWGLISTPFGPQ